MIANISFFFRKKIAESNELLQLNTINMSDKDYEQYEKAQEKAEKQNNLSTSGFQKIPRK